MKMEAIAAELRDSLNARDMTAFRSLIAEDARWGYGGPNDERTCHNRDEIIANYKRLLATGVRGTVTETAVGPFGVACTIEVEWPDSEPNRRGPTIYQAFMVTDGLITFIAGHESHDDALLAISD